MNPDDIVKTAPAIAKGAAAIGAAIPFTAIAKRILGPAADEVAEMMRDHVRLYRYGRQLACVKKAEEIAEKAGFQPTAVSPKILFPLLEGASFEEDEGMHSMWAALLANAANPLTAGKMRPGFIAVLKQMSVDEAALVNWIFTEVKGRKMARPGTGVQFKFEELAEGYKVAIPGSKAGSDLILCLAGLESQALIQRFHQTVNNSTHLMYLPTPRGEAFFDACSEP